MHIMILGVSGFIGRHLYDELTLDGHSVTGCSRSFMPGIRWQILDFNSSTDEWLEQLQDVDIVINAVGIYQEVALQQFSHVHAEGPKRLFAACHQAKIRVIQISAIGADHQQPVTGFLQSKREADQYLLSSDMPNVVLYPGIVLGEKGSTTRQLCLLARLLCIPMVFSRDTALPMISIYQLTDQIKTIIRHWPDNKTSRVLIAQPEPLVQLLNSLRQWMGLGAGKFIPVHGFLLKLVFTLFPGLSVGAFNKQSMAMLSSCSNSSYQPVTEETASSSLMKMAPGNGFINSLRMKTLFYLNLFVLSVIWVVSGISSMLNLEQSREIIALLGIGGVTGDVIIFAAATADILLGVFLWMPRLRRRVIMLQIIVMVIYSMIISIFIPAYWLHPFAPIIKNLAMLVLAMYLLVDEKE